MELKYNIKAFTLELSINISQYTLIQIERTCPELKMKLLSEKFTPISNKTNTYMCLL